MLWKCASAGKPKPEHRQAFDGPGHGLRDFGDFVLLDIAKEFQGEMNILRAAPARFILGHGLL
jgi:hypothetical protein